MRYRLRTLLIAMATVPPILAVLRMLWLKDTDEVDPVLLGVVMYCTVVAVVCWLYHGDSIGISLP
jgi:hypothetical protein